MAEQPTTPEQLADEVHRAVSMIFADAQTRAAEQGHWTPDQGKAWARNMIRSTGYLSCAAIQAAVATYGEEILEGTGAALAVEPEAREPATPSQN